MDCSLQGQVVALVEEVLAVRVVDWLSDTAITSDCTGTIAILVCDRP
ncbi:MAG: DUF2294 family protein [Spirulinaceae cyanobacterium RM2_2_10]|nr:DUF2294 family protein [Spirulinaceae cyanobacterium SM2_1_0]NJO21097.1 DUF2294 family protein [Spirulinaceae cyanobacterium RM2_2_10]